MFIGNNFSPTETHFVWFSLIGKGPESLQLELWAGRRQVKVGCEPVTGW